MGQTTDKPKGKALYLPHGGGPMPLLGDPGHKNMVDFLQKFAQSITRPDAIVVCSAHWEATQPTVSTGKGEELLYDYYGFPEESYSIKYPARGSTETRKEILDLLSTNQFTPAVVSRAFDHGVFVPLKLLYPEANIPLVQISLLNTLDPGAHIEMGRALKKLMEKNILFIGSGFSFHNLSALTTLSDHEDQKNDLFHQWLNGSLCSNGPGNDERTDWLVNWEKAPHARYCHPREEHLLPLHVCYGLFETAAQQLFYDTIIGKKVSAFFWGSS